MGSTFAPPDPPVEQEVPLHKNIGSGHPETDPPEDEKLPKESKDTGEDEL